MRQRLRKLWASGQMSCRRALAATSTRHLRSAALGKLFLEGLLDDALQSCGYGAAEQPA
jgi:hypothetical protein